MAPVVFHMMHCRLIAMKYRLCSVVERMSGLVISWNKVIGAAVCFRQYVMPSCGIVVPGGDGMMLCSAETFGGSNRRRDSDARRTGEITWQRAALVLGVPRPRCLPVFKRTQSVTMSRQRLMRGVRIVLADLVVTRSLAMKMRRLFVMCRSGRMVPCRVIWGGHDIHSRYVLCHPIG